MASATGRSVKQVILDSYALTLYAFLALEDARRLDRLVEEGDRLSLGGLMAVAFNQPERLGSLDRAYRARLQGKVPREEVFRLAAQVLKQEADGLARAAQRTKKRRRR